MDRHNGKRQLRRLREKRGWSWTDQARAIKAMARRLGIDPTAIASTVSVRRTIARWESHSTSSAVPDDRYQWILAHVYAEHNDAVEVGPGSDFLSLLTVLLDLGVTPNRVTELHDAVLCWADEQRSRATAINPTNLTDSKLAELTLSFNAIANLVGKVPFVRSQIALAPLVEHSATTSTGAPACPLTDACWPPGRSAPPGDSRSSCVTTTWLSSITPPLWRTRNTSPAGGWPPASALAWR